MNEKINIDVSRKEILLLGLVVALVAVYLCFFTDWFKNKPIRIEYTTRVAGLPRGARAAANEPAVYAVMFSFNGEFKLTSIKVVAANAFAADPKAPALWHLVADKPTAPVKGFVYGVPIPGMQPFLAGAEAQPIQPGVVYHVIVEAGKRKGERDFSLPGSGVMRR